MLRSLYSGVSGMKNNQIKMDVIANNIANVNTTAFKSGRVRFQDILSQTVKNAQYPTQGGLGGINPRQIGIGVQLAGIDTITNQGAPQPTGRPLDWAVDGEGYFILSNGKEKMYTRDGGFGFDSDFNIINSDGFHVMGYTSSNILKNVLSNNLASGGLDWTIASGTDTLGSDSSININNVTMNFTADQTIDDVVNAINQSSAGVKAELVGNTGLVITPNPGNDNLVIKAGSGVFQDYSLNRAMGYSSNDTLQVAVGDNLSSAGIGGINWGDAKSGNSLADPSQITINGKTFSFTAGTIGDAITQMNLASNETGVTVQMGSGGLVFTPGDNTSRLTVSGGTGTFSGLSIDDNILGGLSIPEAHPQNPSAKIVNYSVQTNGMIKGVYDDNSVVDLGRVAVAKFANPGGLQKIGYNNFSESANSGIAQIQGASSGGRGDVLQSTLEMSNVDLASEFTDMIITSRAFQANSRSITTSDELLQELLNLKR